MKVGFLGLLTLIFITLKLCSVIDWSWWVVLSPLLIFWVITFFALTGGFVIGLIEGLRSRG